MTTFTIDSDNTITAYLAGEAIPNEQPQFNSEKELSKLAANWSTGHLAEIWNGFAGVPPFADLKPVKKFMDRKTAVARIWRAIQALTPAVAPQAADATPDAAKSRKPRTQHKNAAPAREGSKKAIILDMLRRAEGATLASIMSATDWQAHTVRGFISGTLGKKMGLKVESFKSGAGDRAYRIEAR